MVFTGHSAPPFYSNEPDNMHCSQACLRMLFEHFKGKKLSVEEAEYHSAFVPDILTWPFAMQRFLTDNGFQLKNIELLDIDAYLDDMAAAITAQAGETEGRKVVDITNIPKETGHIRALLANPSMSFEYRIPTIDDVITEIKNGCLLMSSLNYYGLEGESEKYCGHLVLIYDVDVENEIVRLHNPGLPPLPAQEVSFRNLLNAMYYPTMEVGKLMSIKLP